MTPVDQMSQRNQLMKAEWIKLRSLRSSKWTMLALVVVTVGLGALFSALTAHHWSHMSAEENEVLPLAIRYLTKADWALIDDAFSGNTDALLGQERQAEFQGMFRRIVDLAPAPIGMRKR